MQNGATQKQDEPLFPDSRTEETLISDPNLPRAYLSLEAANLPEAPEEVRVDSGERPAYTVNELKRTLQEVTERLDISRKLGGIFQKHVEAQKAGTECKEGEYKRDRSVWEGLPIKVLGQFAFQTLLTNANTSFTMRIAIGMAGYAVGMLVWNLILSPLPDPTPEQVEFVELRDKIEAAVKENKLGPKGRLTLYQDAHKKYADESSQGELKLIELKDHLTRLKEIEEREKLRQSELAAEAALMKARDSLGFNRPNN